MSSVMAVEGAMSCSIHGGWTDARVFHGTELFFPARKSLQHDKIPRIKVSGDKNSCSKFLVLWGYVIDHPKYPEVGNASGRVLIPQIHRG